MTGVPIAISINHPKNPAPLGSQTWTTKELMEQFETLAFQSPHVAVKRKSDGAMGLLEFDGHPRIYHSFVTTSA